MPQFPSYPVFEPDQVLTDSSLNALFAYLDEQERLTRNQLLGIGIVCGLQVSVGSGSVSVSRGVGITSLGYLLNFEQKTYTHFRPYTVPDFPDTLPPAVHAVYAGWQAQLLVESEKKEATDKALAAEDVERTHAVVLFLEPKLYNLKNCTTEDCNDKGKQVDITVRPLLVPKTALQGYKYFNLQQQKFNFPSIHFRRWNVPAQNMQHPANVLQAFDNVLNATLLKEVATAYQFVFDLFDPLLNGGRDGAPSNVYTHLTKLLVVARKAYPAHYQYLYDYADDLIKAYHDFSELVFDALSECLPDQNLFPLHLMLGEAGQSSAGSQTAFRHHFLYSPLFNGQKERGEAARMYYRRMILLLTDFDLPSVVKQSAANRLADVRITPSVLGEYPLGQRCLPFYYNPKPLFEFWNYEKSRRGKAATTYGYHADAYSSDKAALQPLLYDTERYNFYRIEGHTGVNVRTALQNIVAQKSRFSLPFDVVAVNMYQGPLLDEAEKARCYFSDLDSHYNVLLSEMLCKLHGVFCAAGKWAFNKKIFDTVFRANTGIKLAARNLNVNASFFKAGTVKTDTASANAEAEADIELDLDNITTGRTLSATFEGSLLKLAALNFLDRTRRMDPYRKGVYLQYFCKPDPKAETVAAYYLNWLKTAAGKRWPKPATATPDNASQWMVILYQHLFYLIDTVEELMGTVLSFDLHELNVTRFKTAYDEVMAEVEAFADYFDNLYHALDILNDQKDLNEQKPFNLIQEEMEDWVIDKAVTKLTADSRGLLMMCTDDRLQQLVYEYKKRQAYVLEQHIFSNYATLKTGLEHKAGVPKGGTFVMLYYDKPGNRLQTSDRLLREGVQDKELEDLLKMESREAAEKAALQRSKLTDAEKLERNVSGIEQLIERNKADFDEEQLKVAQTLLAQVRKLPPSAETLQIAEGIVFADLYLPYQCCSDCAPTAFVFQDKVEEAPQPDIDIRRTFFCNNEDVREPVTAKPEGGTVSGQGITQEGANYFFNPKGLAEADYVLQYKLGAKTDAVTVTIKAVYDPEFSFQQVGIEPTAGGVIVSFAPASQGGQHHWDFGDNSAPSTEPAPKHVYRFANREAVFRVTHSVTNGNCTLPPVTKVVTLVRQENLQLSLDKNPLCTNDRPQPLKYTPDGGKMTCKEAPQAVAQVNGLHHFSPQVSGKGSFTVQYEKDGQSKDLIVKVEEAPSAGFEAVVVDAKESIRVVQFTAAVKEGNHRWKFSDGQSSEEASPKMEFSAKDNPEGIKASHSVSGEVCAASVTKEVSLSVPVTETKREVCYSAEPILLERLRTSETLSVIDDGGQKLTAKGQLTLNKETKVGASRFVLRYLIAGTGGVVEKHVGVIVNRLPEEVKVTVVRGQQMQLEVTARAVAWTVSINHGTPQVVKTGTDNPLVLKVNSEIPRTVEVSFIIQANITTGDCTATLKKEIPAQQYAELIKGGGELIL